MDATVHGSVEQTTQPSSAPAAAPAAVSGSGHAVSVVQLQTDGGFTELATAMVELDGSYEIRGVPPGRTDLAVFTYVDGRMAGSVMLHGTSRAGRVMVAAPINYETTVEAQAYMQVRSQGSGGSADELALLVQMQGSAAETVATSASEVEAVADGYLAASAAMTGAYDASGVDFDAWARADVLVSAATQFAIDRNDGVSSSAAHAAFVDAALDAFVTAGATMQSSVVASAAAASTFDAVLSTQSTERIDIVAEAVRVNVRARERLAAQFSSTAEASLAAEVRGALTQARLALAVVGGLLDLRGILDTTADATANAAIDASVELLASGASTTIRDEVRTRAEAAVQAARLEARLQSATTAEAAASAVTTYRANVRAAVDAMIAASGNTSVNAEAMTALYISACGSAYIR